MKQLNSRGFSHEIVAIAFVAVFAISGVGYLVASHADSCPPASSASSPTSQSTSGQQCAPASSPASAPASVVTADPSPPPNPPPSQSPSQSPSPTRPPSQTPTPGQSPPPSSTPSPAAQSGQPLYRYYNRQSHDYSLGFSATSPSGSYSKPVITFRAYAKASTETSAINGFTKANAHIYSSSSKEKRKLVASGWRDRGVAFNAYLYNGSNRQPVYRLISKDGKHFLLTASRAEIKSLAKSGWKNQGLVFYAPLN